MRALAGLVAAAALLAGCGHDDVKKVAPNAWKIDRGFAAGPDSDRLDETCPTEGREIVAVRKEGRGLIVICGPGRPRSR